jgi:ABC-type transport system involved in multi-copper enzyme maturation permease subunit
MTRVSAIALNTFREAIRNKILYALLFFAVILIVLSLAFAQLSLHEDARITRDMGLGGIELFGALIAIFVGVNLVYKELDRKTVFALIPKPLHRWEFILGKFVGMVLTLAILMAVMGLFLFAVLGFQYLTGVLNALDHSGSVLRAILLLFGEVVVVTAIAVMFSSFSTPFLSGMLTFGLWIIGHFTPEARELIAKLADGASRFVLNALLRIVPDLHLFYVSGSMVAGRNVTVHGEYVDWSYVASASAYGALYAGCALALAMLLFSRRDFV